MSTLKSGFGNPISTAPPTFAELVNYFGAGAKPRAEWKVGAEFEKFHRDAFVERITAFVERVGS